MTRTGKATRAVRPSMLFAADARTRQALAVPQSSRCYVVAGSGSSDTSSSVEILPFFMNTASG